MHFDVERQLQLGGAPQALAQNLFLDLELVVVAGMLVVAAAAAAKVWAGGLDAVRRRLDDGFNGRPGKSLLLFGKGSLDFFSAQDEGNEHGFAASAVVGGQAGQAVAAIDQLFDCKEQEMILR